VPKDYKLQDCRLFSHHYILAHIFSGTNNKIPDFRRHPHHLAANLLLEYNPDHLLNFLRDPLRIYGLENAGITFYINNLFLFPFMARAVRAMTGMFRAI